jgi:hypothetical protein
VTIEGLVLLLRPVWFYEKKMEGRKITKIDE